MPLQRVAPKVDKHMEVLLEEHGPGHVAGQKVPDPAFESQHSWVTEMEVVTLPHARC